MKRSLAPILIASLAVFAMSCGGGGEKETSVPEISAPQATSSLEEIVATGVQMQKLDIPFAFDTAGLPCWVNGDLYFTNNNFDPREKSKTMKLDAQGNFSDVRVNNGVTTCTYQTGKGTFFCCEMLGHRVVEMAPDGSIVRTVAGEYGGVRLDGPNDITIDSKGGIYFTDSRFSPGEDLLQDVPAVYYVKPDGGVARVIDGIEYPNGLELSPDGSTLYIVNTKGADKGVAVYAFGVKPDGTVADKRIFAEIELTPENAGKVDGISGADGTAIDTRGNLYVATTQGLGIQVFNSKGVHLGNIPCPTVCNNMSFGGADMKTLYISAKDGVYSMPVLIPGKNPPM